MVDNTTKAPLSTKQKVIGAVTVVIFGFIIYEVIGLFSSGDTAAPAITPAAKTTTQQKQMSSAMPATGNATPTATMPQQSAAAPGTLASVNAITFPKENVDIQKQQQQQQQSYLESVNQLQLIKVKREIAENNQAIATARLATETANKTMSDLLTQPAVLPQPPGGGLSAMGNNGKPGTSQTVGQLPDGMLAPIAGKSQVLDIPFTVISVSMQSNRWNAVLSYQDKLYSVSIGDSLFDGSKVVSISKNGVSLFKDGNKRKISIQTII